MCQALEGRPALVVVDDAWTIDHADMESGKEIATFTGDGEMSSCAVAPDGRTIIGGDQSGRVHFLQLVEADETKLLLGEIKIPLLLHEQQPANKTEESNSMLPPNARVVLGLRE